MPTFASALIPLPPFFHQIETARGVIAINASQNDLRAPLTATLVALAAQGQRIAIVLANNDFDVYALVRLAKQEGLEPRPILRRIEITRTETVHQVKRCFQRLADSPAGFSVVLAIGLLEPFQDEDILWTDAQRLLNDTLAALKELSVRQVKVLVTLPQLKHSTRPYLMQQLARQVDSYIEFAPPLPLAEPAQLRLL